MSLATTSLLIMVILIIEKDKLFTSRFCFQQFIIWQSRVSTQWKVVLLVFTFTLLKSVLENFNCSVSMNVSMKKRILGVRNILSTVVIACFNPKMSPNYSPLLVFILLKIIAPLPPCLLWQCHLSTSMSVLSWWHCHVFPCSPLVLLQKWERPKLRVCNLLMPQQSQFTYGSL